MKLYSFAYCLWLLGEIWSILENFDLEKESVTGSIDML